MNKVMCLEFDLGCHIYYQFSDNVRIEEAFKAKYGSKPIGSNFRQFHSDFQTINEHKETPHTI